MSQKSLSRFVGQGPHLSPPRPWLFPTVLDSPSSISLAAYVSVYDEVGSGGLSIGRGGGDEEGNKRPQRSTRNQSGANYKLHAIYIWF